MNWKKNDRGSRCLPNHQSSSSVSILCRPVSYRAAFSLTLASFTLGEKSCKSSLSPARPSSLGPRSAPASATPAGPHTLQASGAPCLRTREDGGRGRRFPDPYSRSTSLTCPARFCKERKTSQTMSRERLGLQLRSRLLSPMVGRLSSAAAAMTLSQAAPANTKVRSLPTPPSIAFVAPR